jgi:hypothetical protein
MKTIIYLFTIVLALNGCKGKKEAMAKKEEAKTEATQAEKQEMTDTEREAAIVEQMKNEKLPNEGEDYYNMVSKEIPSNAVARIQRTACFGRCPIYTLTVFEGGRVEYFGKKFTPREGRFESTISPEVIEKLITEAGTYGFFELNNVYDKQAITDLPSTITSVKNAEGMKTVVNRFNGPETLRGFEQYFDNLFNELEWNEMETK